MIGKLSLKSRLLLIAALPIVVMLALGLTHSITHNSNCIN